ncbi:hypothetical protein N7528_008500 [Penicillium herquei]|nr:hypothetical protein N7528_008500 [Penicillium herquei]
MSVRVEPQGDPTHQLVVKEPFNRLTEREKLYSHHLSRAAWYGTRVILRQTSPESNAIFDLIMALHKACNGCWIDWIADSTVTQLELSAFLDYAAIFLNNIGNYFADGGRKIIPNLSADALRKLAKHSGWAEPALEHVIERILSTVPSSFGYPSKTSQANYYPGEDRITREEIALILRAMEMHRIEPENTRIHKRKNGDKWIFEVLQASIDDRCFAKWDKFEGHDITIRILGGDHNEEMAKICDSLEQAKMYSSNESLRLKEIVRKCDNFLRQMPWAVPDINNGKGPFEKYLFDPPDFVSVQALTSCSSIIWHGINLPNYNDIRETCGFKNIVIANRLSAENDTFSPCFYVHSTEMKRYKECAPTIANITVAVHELVGHGSGKLLAETSPGEFNFDKENPPNQPSHWLSEECRAELVSLYLMGNKELLSLFGHDSAGSITPEELLYFTYLHIGVQGLQALRSYNADEQIWGDSHRSGQFAILKYLIIEGGGALEVNFDSASNGLVVAVNEAKIATHGQPFRPWMGVTNFGEKPCAPSPEPRWKFVQPNTVLDSNGVFSRFMMKAMRE